MMDKAASSTSASARNSGAERRLPRTLAVDVGGTGIKAELLDERGRPLSERARIPTPKNATPARVIAIVRKLASMRSGFDRVSVGFPGLIKDGVVYSAPNLGRGWNDFNLQGQLRRILKRPVRVANDADVQGLGAVTGHGVELVITLGTGFGSVLFVDGHRIHLELGHHPFRKGRTYEDELGHRTLKKKGKARWNRRLREAIDDLKRTFNYDQLFIGGGNTKYMRFQPPERVKIVSNEDGLLGGIKLWKDASHPSSPAAPTTGSASSKPPSGATVVVTTEVRAIPKPGSQKRSAAKRVTTVKTAAQRKVATAKPALPKPAAKSAPAGSGESKSAVSADPDSHADASSGVADSGSYPAIGGESTAEPPRADGRKMPV